MDDKLLSKTAVSKLFGVSVRRIEQLQQDGVIVGEGSPMKFPLAKTVQAYIKYLSDKAYAREQKKTDVELEQEKLAAEVRIKRAKAEMEEIELKELRAEMHRAEDVEAITTDHVFFVKSMIMALPGKLAVDLSGTHTAPEQAARVKQETDYILQRLAEYRYDPEEYKKRVRERRGWREKEGEE